MDSSLARLPIDQRIAALCGTIAAQRERIFALEDLAMSRGDDAATLRIMYRQAMALLHDVTERERRHQERYLALLQEVRELRRADVDRAA